jgi:hypothetical protein
MKTFTFFQDPGHGWIRVTLADCRDVGLDGCSFSRYSFFDEKYLYLEEDCDASKFVAAFTAKYGDRPYFKESHSNRDSAIRRKRRLAGV